VQGRRSLPKAAAYPKLMLLEIKPSYYQPPSDAGEGGVVRQSAVEAGARERKIPAVISHNDTSYFATASGLDAYGTLAAGRGG